MSDPYITLWSQPQVELERRSSRGASTLDHAASAQFRARGVQPGDRVYVVATDGGRLLLLGRLTVEHVVDQATADAYFGERVYEAPDHLLGAGTLLRPDRLVPERVARAIERESGKRIKIAADRYRVDANSLRTTGRITAESAALLDEVLDDVLRVDADEVGFLEGGRQMRRHLGIERSAALRSAALAVQGTRCRICGFSFAAAYGSIGDGFAEVHHLAPLGRLGKEVRVHPARDVIVVCANCHRMLHRREPPLAPDELRRALSQPEPSGLK